MYRIFDRVVDEALDDRYRRREYYERPRDPRTDIEQEVKLMYARGEINSNSYHRLLEMAQSGQLGWDDLARVRSEKAPQVQSTPPTPQRERHPQMVRSLNRLYAHRSRLDEARAETEQTLERLEADVDRLRRQAKTADEKAQLTLPDEEKAREYLQVKQEVLDRIRTLEERITSLRQSLHQSLCTIRADVVTDAFPVQHKS
jgi:predicted ribosome quality control (RQC) complex YloA/Tae2 family protein